MTTMKMEKQIFQQFSPEWEILFLVPERENHSDSINYKLSIHDDVPANCFYLCSWSFGKVEYQ